MRRVLVSILTVVVAATLATLSLSGVAQAQIPAGILNAVQPGTGADQLPAGVRRVGTLEISVVSFDQKPLFAVAGPIVRNREDPGSLIPVEVRAAQIEENLRQVLIVDPKRTVSLFGAYDTVYDPRTFKVEVKKVDTEAVLVAGDAAHGDDLQLMTVTALDAKYYGMTVDDLAKRLQQQLQDVLVASLASRQPDLVRRHVARVPQILGVMLAITLLLWLGRLRVRSWEKKLEAETNDETGRAAIDRNLDIASILNWTSASLLAATWLGGALWIMSLFPSTASLAQRFWTQLLYLVLIWFFAGLLDRIGNALTARIAEAWKKLLIRRDDDSRQSLRIPTIVRALEGFKALLIYLIAIGLSLKLLGLPSASVLTVGALLAFALSFAAQSIVKDLTTGFLILTEDQFAIGDVVTIGTMSGTVENLNLRITQVRDDRGRLITIPNSQITIVENATRTWSRVDFTIDIASDTDVERALNVLAEVAQGLYTDPEWYARIVEPPSVLGVEAITTAGITLRVWVVTAPAQQYAVRRELNRRVLVAFNSHNISLGIPQQVVHDAVPEVKGADVPEDAKKEPAAAAVPNGAPAPDAPAPAQTVPALGQKAPASPREAAR
jgi:small conductance mechanosensitive channel